MNFDDYFTVDTDYVPTTSKSGRQPRQVFIDNIERQKKLFLGETVYTIGGKKNLPPTFEHLPNGIVRIGIRYGKQWVPLKGGLTHLKVLREKFIPAMDYLIELARNGEFDEELEACKAAATPSNRTTAVAEAE